MATPDDLVREMRAERRKMTRCCGPVAVNYEPGCMFARCCRCNFKVAVPDWDPAGLREKWNQTKTTK